MQRMVFETLGKNSVGGINHVALLFFYTFFANFHPSVFVLLIDRKALMLPILSLQVPGGEKATSFTR